MFKNILKEFPILDRKINGKKIIYLDSACSALKLKYSAQAQMDYLLEYGSCAGKRSTHYLSELAEEKFHYAREKIAYFINSLSEEIIFVSGTTEGINLAANSLLLNKSDEIVISGLEHNSVFLPFYRLSKEKGIKLKIIPLKNYQPDFSSFKKILNKNTKLLCITAASNIFGGDVKYEKFLNEAQRMNIPVLMDCAQYAPSHKIDINKMGDIIAFSGHKMGAPFGTGVLYIKKDLMFKMNSSKLGGGTIKSANFSGKNIKVELLKNYMSFEAGIQNYAGIWSLFKTMEFLNQIGMENIRKHISNLAIYAFEKLSSIKEIQILGSDFDKGSLISFKPLLKNFSVQDFSIYLSDDLPDYIIAIRCGKLCADLPSLYSGIDNVIRISFFIYNSEKDIDVFVDSLKKYLKIIKK